MDLPLALTALALGLAYAATPGGVNAECIRRGISGGFRPAISVQVGGMAGGSLWAALGLGGVAALGEGDSIGIALAIGGGLFLCGLAFAALRDALSRRGTPDTSARSAGSLRTGLVFGVANPAGLAFWAGVGGGYLAARTAAPDAGDYGLFLLAFQTGVLLFSITFSGLVSWGRRFARPGVFRTVDAVCGALLGYFGLRMLWTGFRRLARAAL